MASRSDAGRRSAKVELILYLLIIVSLEPATLCDGPHPLVSSWTSPFLSRPETVEQWGRRVDIHSRLPSSQGTVYVSAPESARQIPLTPLFAGKPYTIRYSSPESSISPDSASTLEREAAERLKRKIREGKQRRVDPLTPPSQLPIVIEQPTPQPTRGRPTKPKPLFSNIFSQPDPGPSKKSLAEELNDLLKNNPPNNRRVSPPSPIARSPPPINQNTKPTSTRSGTPVRVQATATQHSSTRLWC